MLSKETLERYRKMTPGQRLALSLHAIYENEEALLYGKSAQFSGASLESHIDAQCVEWRAPGFRLYFNKAGDPFRSFSLLVSHWATIVIAFLLLLSEIAVRFSRRSRLRESEGFSRATNVG